MDILNFGARKSLRLQRKAAKHVATQSCLARLPAYQHHFMNPLKRKREHSQPGSDGQVKPEADVAATGEHVTNQCRRTRRRIKKEARKTIKTESLPTLGDQEENLVLPLSKENLRLFDQLTSPKMANTVASLKRSSSQRSDSLPESSTAHSRSSGSTAAFYRKTHLRAVQIHVHAEPPERIEVAIHEIIDADVGDERLREIQLLAQKMSIGCLENVKAQAGEDNCIDPFYSALKSFNLRDVHFLEKADWRPELKPSAKFRKPRFSLSFMADVANDDISERPQKRPANAYVSPKSSGATAFPNVQKENPPPPPQPPIFGKRIEQYPVKLPRPDITIGTKLDSLITKLSAEDLNETEAREFFDWLQTEMVDYKSYRSIEPALLPVPFLREVDLAFPFAVVEGKAYSTGRQIFEAENQAVVSAACALKIQIDLDELVHHTKKTKKKAAAAAKAGLEFTNEEDGEEEVTLESDALLSPPPPPLFFSVTTQGPIHELWAHWTIVKDGVRMFESKLIDSCNAILPKQTEAFMVKVKNIGLWGTGAFVDSVVERLRIVAKKAMA